jgi:hypothetical protein
MKMKKIFTRRVLSVFLVLAGSLTGSTFAAAQSFDGFDRRIDVVNDSPYAVIHLYASNIGANIWGPDMLGRYVLPAGDNILGSIDDGKGDCNYDVKAVLSNGRKLIKWNVNVCLASYLNITGYEILASYLDINGDEILAL